ncbi:MAG: hypothetical protein SF339_14320 [Blastocatellia bacterium]|nr:hypothetical protein [Blastocatellia bacterium]
MIGVPANIDEEGLRMTLAKAADEHQDYSQRDYMLSSHLWVEAYLVDGDRRSTLAGRLRRYVPPANGVKEYLIYDIFLHLLLAKGDTFNIALRDARQSLGLR